MMNRIHPMLREIITGTTAAALVGGLLTLSGCSDPEPPPPPPAPKQKRVEKPKPKAPDVLKAELGIDARIHMPLETAHSDESVRVAGFLLAQAMLEGDVEMALRLTGTDQGMRGMLENSGFISNAETVERLDLEFGRVLGEDAMLVLWEFPEHLDVQMWSIAGPVPTAETAFFWESYESDTIEQGTADVTAADAWSWSDGSQVAFFATPGLVGMIDFIGEEPFRDWTEIIEGWQEIAKQSDEVIKFIDADAIDDSESNQPSGSGFGGRPRGGGGGSRPGITPR